MPVPFPHQIAGARFLAERDVALLADQPRVGKTGSSIMACDYVLARNVLVVTKASARANWGRELAEWGFPRIIQVVYSAKERLRPDAEAVVVGWPVVFEKALLARLLARLWDVLILDESHEAKSPETKRAIAAYGDPADAEKASLHDRAKHVWCLTGTPVANAPNDLYPMLRALAPQCIDGMSYDAFMRRYCTYKLRLIGTPPAHVFFAHIAKVRGDALEANAEKGWPEIADFKAFRNRYGLFDGKTVRRNVDEFEQRIGVRKDRYVRVVTGGTNLAELSAKIDGFWLRRTQEEVGIGRPIFSTFTVHADRLPPELRDIEHAAEILDAAENGDTATLEMHLGPLRRVTGVLKAHAIVEAVREELDDGLDKIVLMAWHKEVLAILRDGLSSYGVVCIEGATPARDRQPAVDAFQQGSARVFVGQIQAAGEAIDLSSSANLMFVESSFTPMHMAQAALRITNHGQKRQTLVRVAALEGSVDEALQRIVVRKVTAIRQLNGD